MGKKLLPISLSYENLKLENIYISNRVDESITFTKLEYSNFLYKIADFLLLNIHVKRDIYEKNYYTNNMFLMPYITGSIVMNDKLFLHDFQEQDLGKII